MMMIMLMIMNKDKRDNDEQGMQEESETPAVNEVRGVTNHRKMKKLHIQKSKLM